MRQSLSAKCSVLFNIPNSVNSSSADVNASRLSFWISQVRLHKLNRISRSLVSNWGPFTSVVRFIRSRPKATNYTLLHLFFFRCLTPHSACLYAQQYSYINPVKVIFQVKHCHVNIAIYPRLRIRIRSHSGLSNNCIKTCRACRDT